MVGASKILTVSYGTFSCTLEGFDNPFNTMKAIAEYFRDLAADDRYFGAEPPTPDAAMLHQIAEREMKRRVEARIQDNGVILRASEADHAAQHDSRAAHTHVPAGLGHSAAQLVPDSAELPADPDTLFEDQHIDRPVAETAEVDPSISESVAAKLSRIRTAMVESRSSGETTRPPANMLAKQAEAEARAKAERVAAAQAEAEARAKAERDAAAQAEAEARAKAERDAAEQAEAEARAKAERDAAAQAEAEARAKAERDAAEQAEAEARAKAENDAQKAAAEDDALVAALAGAFDDEDFATNDRFDDDVPRQEPDAPPLPEPRGDATQVGPVGNNPAPVTPEQASRTGPLPDVNLFDDDEDDEDDFAELASLDTKATTVKPKAPSLPPAAPNTLETPVAAEPADISQKDGAAEINPTLQRARARVVKIRRVSAAESPDAPSAEQKNTTPPKTAKLSPEDEADLMRELAELRGETDSNASETPSPAPVEPEAATDAAVAPVRPLRPTATRRRSDDLSSTEDDASVKRLLDQTNNELQGSENRRRLSAIAHLKAAVAATVADRASGGDQGPTEEMRMNPYRSDLERAVRRRSAEVAQDRPAPLVLVSEQRIDAPRAKPTTPPSHITPVRPRRVPVNHTTKAEEDAEIAALKAALDGPMPSFEEKVPNTPAPASVQPKRETAAKAASFADYAESLGADSLPSLLEAALAYAAQVEGRPEVTRPEVLEHVLTVQPSYGKDRETLLRSFGSLLRDGRIEKASRGHFMLGQASPMQAEVRKVAQA
jgi:hypothetical protein